jgi:hypothetical protein
MMVVTCGDIGEEYEIVRFEPFPEEIPVPVEQPVTVPAEPEKVPA